jgi:DNA-binding response OmpR family regulator
MTDATVLVVEDERGLADMYATWLAEAGYETQVAYDGPDAMEALSPELDIALLDRRLPRMTGDDILDEIRDRNYHCEVAMVTAVDPDVDIVGMRYDEYITKPIKREQITETVERLADSHADEKEDRILSALGNRKTRECLRSLNGEPKDAGDLVEATGYSETTIYRRLNKLQQAGLITSVSEGSDGDTLFKTIADRIDIKVGDGLEVDTDRKERA